MFREITADALGEKKWPFEVDRHDPVETFFAHFKQVCAYLRGDSGVVDQRFEGTEGLQELIQQRLPVVPICDIGLDVERADSITVFLVLLQRVENSAAGFRPQKATFQPSAAVFDNSPPIPRRRR